MGTFSRLFVTSRLMIRSGKLRHHLLASQCCAIKRYDDQEQTLAIETTKELPLRKEIEPPCRLQQQLMINLSFSPATSLSCTLLMGTCTDAQREK